MERKPTEKQVAYATAIFRATGVSLPKEFTLKAYQKYISSNKPLYDEQMNDLALEYEGCLMSIDARRDW